MRWRHLLGTAATVAAVCTYPAAPALASDTGETPGTYASWNAPGDVSSFTMPMTLQKDPGDYNAYWSTQFDFTNDASGYMGFQTHEDGGGMFIVSIWNGQEATAGDGAYCEDFEEGGTGKTCRIDARPVEGHAYKLDATQESDGFWRYTVNDTTAGTSTELGRIKIDGDHAIAGSSFISWTEYFDWNDPNTVCADAKYSKFLFGQPATSEGQGEYTGSSLGEYCQDIANVTLDDNGATQENGNQ